ASPQPRRAAATDAADWAAFSATRRDHHPAAHVRLRPDWLGRPTKGGQWPIRLAPCEVRPFRSPVDCKRSRGFRIPLASRLYGLKVRYGSKADLGPGPESGHPAATDKRTLRTPGMGGKVTWSG